MMASTEQRVSQLRQAASQFCVQALQETEQAIAAAKQSAEQAIAEAVQTAEQAIQSAMQQSGGAIRTALQNVQNTRAGVANALGSEARPQRAAAPVQPQQAPLPQGEDADVMDM